MYEPDGREHGQIWETQTGQVDQNLCLKSLKSADKKPKEGNKELNQFQCEFRANKDQEKIVLKKLEKLKKLMKYNRNITNNL